MLHGHSLPMQHVRELLGTLALAHATPILVTGETGTGKELAARMIHEIAAPDDPFVAVNCAAITESLLESELFGHVKGAFTGATENRMGAFRAAGRGVLLLDEVSEMAVGLQAKLLRVLDGYGARAVGADTDYRPGCIVVATSNRVLAHPACGFRRDLYHRLSAFQVDMPPLRERNGDAVMLAEMFLAGRKRLTRLAKEAMRRYAWPGNVRELRNMMERAVLTESSGAIGERTLLPYMQEYVAADVVNCDLRRAEAQLIRSALRQSNGDKVRAAGMLGICRSALYDKMRRHGIPLGDAREETNTR